IFGGKMNSNQKVITTEKIEGFNTNMPGVDTNISKGEIKDKFAAYQQAFKNVTDQSAMSDMEKPNAGVQGLNYKSSYSSADMQRLEAQRKMDSLNQVLKFGQSKIQGKIAEYNRSGGFGESRQTTRRNPGDGYLLDDNESGKILLNKLLQQQQDIGQQDSKATFNTDNESPGSYDSQMRVFHEQMKYVDSMQHANGGTKEENKNETKRKFYAKEFNPKKDTSFKPLPITSTSSRRQNVFNTVRNFEDEDDNIAAMIDQDVKAVLGSRVRIRLLKDMYVGDYLINRGTYIYGVVTGFQKQRVNISIAQVLYNNTSLPVKIDLFDNDGYLGLYVPGSNFREFSKEIGTQATQGLSQVATPDNSDVRMNMLSQLFNTTTTTLSSLIRKNKAFLKYNYIVYLKENKSSND
ncbi:MAG TPA: conjugative transposon protein TraM, partial [Hanamia sp.]|nr:conjugative transposon protein TraM [Hanamia sp.]